jgi:hypothetical protein
MRAYRALSRMLTLRGKSTGGESMALLDGAFRRTAHERVERSQRLADRQRLVFWASGGGRRHGRYHPARRVHGPLGSAR